MIDNITIKLKFINGQKLKMIDNIMLLKRGLSDSEKRQIVKKSALKEISYNNKWIYNNDDTYKLVGISIRINELNELRIKGSLHKYYNYPILKKLVNHNRFTMRNAKEAFYKLIENIGFNPENTYVTAYEIGLNVEIQENPKQVMKQIKSIGKLVNTTKEKEYFVNPNYKDKRYITTYKYRDIRVYHKVYDKIFEMQDKRKPTPKDINIIRIETAHRRVEKTLLFDFITENNLKRLQNYFFDTWEGLNFEYDIEAPKGTHKSKKELVKEIFIYGKNIVMDKCNEQYKRGTLTKKMYYDIKKLIDNWDDIKHDFKIKKTEIFTIWENSYLAEKQFITSNFCLQ